MIDDEKIIDLFFERSEQGIRELENKYGQKIIDIRPTARYNIVNLIRKPSDHCYEAES